MQMSKACTPPVQPSLLDSEANHPRFREYQQYRQAMISQLVRGDSFTRWLEQVEKEENGEEIVFEVTSTKAILKPGWYKNVFAPGKSRDCTTHGPFGTQLEAEQA